MTYPVSLQSLRLLNELDELRSEARALLDFASPGACEEWTKFEGRFPSGPDLRGGMISLSHADLEEMRSKTCRFRDILEAGRPQPQAECPE